MSIWSFSIPMEFGMRLDTSTGDASAKLRNDVVILAPKIACPNSDDKISYQMLKWTPVELVSS